MLLFKRYEYDPQKDLIGKGGFSRVYKALDKKFKRYLAIKIYKSSELSERYSPIAEIQRVIQLDHPNIARYIDIDEIEKEDSFGQIEKIQVCVMELLEGGNFEKHYNMHKNLEIFKKLLIDVLHGLSYLHRNEIIHRDIKPANILIKQNLDGPVAKITDFGISKKSDGTGNSSSSALIVSIPYMAPEQLNAQKYGIGEKIHYNIDLWALGVTVYEIITGDVLFKSNEQDSSEQIMANIISAELPQKISFLPEPFNEFVSKCVIKDAKQRVKSADDLLPILLQSLSESKKIDLIVEHSAKESTTPEPFHENKSQEKTVLDDTTELSKGPDPVKEDVHQNTETKDLTAADDTIEITKSSIDRVTRDVLQDDKDNKPAAANNTNEITKPLNDLVKNYVSENEEDNEQVDETMLIEKAVVDQSDTTEVKKVTELIVSNDTPQMQEETAILVKPKNEQEPAKITLFNRYDYYPASDLIGKGGFSRVYKALDQKLSRWVALKIYKTSEFSDRYSPIAEIKRVVNLDHSNICRYLDIEEIDKINPFGETEKIQVCVMELLDSGNFAEYFNKNGRDLEVLKKLLEDVLHGISYLHKNGIIHRDIKPANILIKKTIEGPVAKITDFGISKVSDSLNNNSSSALIVSIPYMAPELLNPKKYGINEKISFNLDLWSLGVTIYEVITGRVLFKDSEQDSSEQIMANIMTPEIPQKINELPHPFKSIVSHCIIKNANQRAQKAEELLVLLRINEPELLKIPEPVAPVFETAPAPKSAPEVETKKTEPDITVPITPASSAIKRKFLIEEPAPQKEERSKKQINLLRISIAAAVVLLVVASFFYFTLSNDEKKPNNITIKNDTIKKIPSVPDKKPEPESTKVNTVINTKDSLPKNVLPDLEKRTKQAKKVVIVSKSEIDASTPLPVVRAGKYIFEISTNEPCTITKNEAFVGDLQAGKKLQLSLARESYKISATNKEGRILTKNIDKGDNPSGKKAYWTIKF
ncbi:MAG: protein kinase [Ferruginibacter sp.]